MMDTANPQKSQIAATVQRFWVLIWYRLRSPQVTGVLLVILGVVLLVGVALPQQPEADTPFADWVATLPFWLQPWGEPLHLLQLSKVFQSPWFWAPVAFLLFHSLIALADYTMPSWKRAQTAKDMSSLEWQHPLARRFELLVRLPASPDGFLGGLKEELVAKGFSLDPPLADDERVISAAWRRRSWLGILTFYGGLILLCVTFLLSYYYLNAESMTLWPLNPQESELLNGTFELTEIDGRSGLLVFSSEKDRSQAVPWRLYVPRFFGSILVWPAATELIVTVEVKNAEDELVTLIPLQEDLPPTNRLSLNRADEPFYFLIPATSLAFQVSPMPASGEGDYNVQVRRKSDTVPSDNLMVNLNQTFEVDDYSVTIGLNYKLYLIARRDWLLLLVFVVIVIVVIASAGVLYFRPPWQLWLVPEVKGRGGQLYGVVEKFYATKESSEFLERLLIEDAPAADPESKI